MKLKIRINKSGSVQSIAQGKSAKLANAFKLAVSFTALGFLSGCVAYRIPTVPPPSVSVASQTRQLTLGIERRSPSYVSRQEASARAAGSEQDFINVVRERGTFKEVNFVDQLSTPPDIILKEAFFGTFDRPYDKTLLYVSGGVIPLIRDTPYLLEFELIDRNGRVVSAANFKEEEPSVVGWGALPMKLNSRWEGKKIAPKVIMGRFASKVEQSVDDYNRKRQ